MTRAMDDQGSGTDSTSTKRRGGGFADCGFATRRPCPSPHEQRQMPKPEASSPLEQNRAAHAVRPPAVFPRMWWCVPPAQGPAWHGLALVWRAVARASGLFHPLRAQEKRRLPLPPLLLLLPPLAPSAAVVAAAVSPSFLLSIRDARLSVRHRNALLDHRSLLLPTHCRVGRRINRRFLGRRQRASPPSPSAVTGPLAAARALRLPSSTPALRGLILSLVTSLSLALLRISPSLPTPFLLGRPPAHSATPALDSAIAPASRDLRLRKGDPEAKLRRRLVADAEPNILFHNIF
ncbi:hypothetical protein TCAP_07221 [Tolypocladium capitatum]|uniref:Uncharacterized protein n=1 Tax=Tolypocladium capitatum TaxID=45235 RepID=A0A2K3Q2E4_9HYPO|nr:hypothetical protein TCAP_07221 [Tolypocladium capitatum]